MAGSAVFLSQTRGNPPDMRFMTLVALHAKGFYVEFVLSNRWYIFMAPKAVPPIRSNLFMGFMALITTKLHWGITWHSYLYSLLYDLLRWCISLNINSAFCDKAVPY